MLAVMKLVCGMCTVLSSSSMKRSNLWISTTLIQLIRFAIIDNFHEERVECIYSQRKRNCDEIVIINVATIVKLNHVAKTT